MNSGAAIDLKDWYTLVAIWEFYNRKWRLAKVTRLREAITLGNQPKRLVFPTGIDPNAVWRKQSKLKVGNGYLNQNMLPSTSSLKV